VRKVPGLEDERRLLATPTWSADGRYLYCCSAPNAWTNLAQARPDTHTTVRYDLMRVPYDPHRDQWGRPEVVLAASDLGFSVAQPRLSPDGHWLFFCACDHGAFPPYDSHSDLYALDLRSAQSQIQSTVRKLELNSDQSESWLSWSSNSRWVVFSSKRLGALFSRPSLAYVAADGHCAKAFVLPQRDPDFYSYSMKTYTIPTLSTGPVRVPPWKWVEAIRQPVSATLSLPGVTPDPKAVDHP
jgi:Tol biopolymer transport system component